MGHSLQVRENVEALPARQLSHKLDSPLEAREARVSVAFVIAKVTTSKNLKEMRNYLKFPWRISGTGSSVLPFDVFPLSFYSNRRCVRKGGEYAVDLEAPSLARSARFDQIRCRRQCREKGELGTR